MPGSELFDEQEIEALAEVIRRKVVHRYAFQAERGGRYLVEEFEQAVAQRFGVKRAHAVSSGSAALLVAMRAFGLGPGDEVITTPFTFVASVEAVLECGAIPVLAEIDESLNLDPSSVEYLVTERTKAIMPVHMFGSCADMDAITSIARKHGLYVFEDACQAMGATYKGHPAGSMGYFGTYSLDPYKVITTGEGGVITTNDEDFYRRCEYFSDHGHVHNHAIDRGAEDKACLGFNYRMSELQGALGLVQLKKLDRAIQLLRENKRRILNNVGKIDGLKLRKHADPEGEIATQLVFILPDAESARRFQRASAQSGAPCGILSNNLWHFVNNWQHLRDRRTYGRKCPFECPYNEGSWPTYRPVEYPQSTDALSRSVVYGLKILMSEQEIERISEAISRAAKEAL